MTFSLRFKAALLFSGMTLALAAFFATSSFAAGTTPSSPVQVYLGQPGAAAVNAEGVLPEGMVWNKPLKAGDLVLQRKDEKKNNQKKSIKRTDSPRLPVGELRPPVLGSGKSSVATPKLNAPKNSTSSLMLLQGMKNALQQAGHNSEIPESNLNPVSELMVPEVKSPEPKTLDSAELFGSITEELHAPVLQPMDEAEKKEIVAPEQNVTIPAPVIDETGFAYEPGQAPKSLAPPKGVAPLVATHEEIVELPVVEGTNEVSLDEPKATDLVQAPPSLSAVIDGDVPAPTEDVLAPPVVAKAPADDTDSLFSSIFGSSVEERTETAQKVIDDTIEDVQNAQLSDGTDEEFSDKIPESSDVTHFLPVKENIEPLKPCEPSVEKWTRDCQEAGYPSYFKGVITGETRVACPSNETREVWISNSCAAALAGEPVPTSLPTLQPSTESLFGMGADDKATPKPFIEPEVIMDGACGGSNGLATLVRPSADLCMAGRPSSVSGVGPWRWNCDGIKGGMTVSCAAPLAEKASLFGDKPSEKVQPGMTTALQDGRCGASAGNGFLSAPTNDLCIQGRASAVSGSGPWSWACSGLNGGTAAACNAERQTDGLCGRSGRDGVDGIPSRDLCQAGLASAVTGQGPWNWTCSGLYGGAPVLCAAQPKINAVCGTAATKGHRDAPKDDLCAVGQSAKMDGDGPWSWSCEGSHGGANVLCQAPTMLDAVCGLANGSQYLKTPSAGLCSKGRSTLVTGEGPWHWSCMGDQGGETVGCAASLGTTESLKDTVACGEASETMAFTKPSDKLCAAGQASDVDGAGPWTWSCADQAGHSLTCSTLSASDGACGLAKDKATDMAPHLGLCEGGLPSDVKADRDHLLWTWSCAGSMGGDSISCTAPISDKPVVDAKVDVAEDVTAACGVASGRSYVSKPDSELCTVGSPTKVTGDGPWLWSCKATGKKAAEVDCEADRLVDGACGNANGSIQKTAPISGLCATGAATQTYGNGPWMWSCVGAAGGNSASCSALSQAQTKVDGLCGATSGTSVTAKPSSDLCSSGAPSSVYGDGPWTWTCSGLNGGIASTCSANKFLPKAPPPPGPLTNGLCGPSNGVATKAKPDSGLCSTGTLSALAGNGPWTWSCIGMNGGMTVSCVAPLMPPDSVIGSCGDSSGVPALTRPQGSLCSAGISSAVSGSGPWTWSCSGTNGGGAVSCVAPKAGGSGPVPSLVTPSLQPESRQIAPTPSAAPLGLVTPTLPSKSLKPHKANVMPNRTSSVKKKSSIVIPDTPKSTKLATGEVPNRPRLNEETKATAVTPPAVKDTFEPTPGIEPPVTDSQGKPIPGAKLVLEPDVSLISFKAGAAQLDESAVAIAENLAKILLEKKESRITLISYSSTAVGRSPREARRLSLDRALAIRDFMASKGVATSRVDVRPMGVNVQSGDMDRVDVIVN